VTTGGKNRPALDRAGEQHAHRRFAAALTFVRDTGLSLSQPS
jgi:hypothetical protein